MKGTLAVLSSTLILLVSACENREPIGRDFGDSVRHNMSVHIINPSPRYGQGPGPDMSGVRAGGAITRYEQGEVEDLNVESTSSKAAK